MRTEMISVEMDDGREITLPSRYEVCGTCRGNGKHSLRFGAITQEDRDRDWDEDSWEDYMSGRYDETCGTCEGQRVVLVVDREGIEQSHNPDLIAALAEYDEQAEIDAEIEAEHRAEIAFGC